MRIERSYLVGRKCCFCKKKITDGKDADLLIGGSAGKKGKPMHTSCYERVVDRLFRG